MDAKRASLMIVVSQLIFTLTASISTNDGLGDVCTDSCRCKLRDSVTDNTSCVSSGTHSIPHRPQGPERNLHVQYGLASAYCMHSAHRHISLRHWLLQCGPNSWLNCLQRQHRGPLHAALTFCAGSRAISRVTMDNSNKDLLRLSYKPSVPGRAVEEP